MDSTANAIVYEACSIDQANSQVCYTDPSALIPSTRAQHARQPSMGETAKAETMLPVHCSELPIAPIGGSVGTALSLLPTFQADSAAVLAADHFRPSPNNNTNNF